MVANVSWLPSLQHCHRFVTPENSTSIGQELTHGIQGPNGPLPDEFLKLYPEVSVVKRQGEVNAWDNAEFRAAIKATNKSQIIIAGIVTDVCK